MLSVIEEIDLLARLDNAVSESSHDMAAVLASDLGALLAHVAHLKSELEAASGAKILNRNALKRLSTPEHILEKAEELLRSAGIDHVHIQYWDRGASETATVCARKETAYGTIADAYKKLTSNLSTVSNGSTVDAVEKGGE